MQTIELKYPVDSSGKSINTLTMRRSKVKDRLVVAKMKSASDEEKEIRLFANLCEVEQKIIEELDESDYATLQKAYMDFFKSEGISDEPSLFSQK